MAAIRSFCKTHPVRAYYLLTFSLSWAGILAAAVPSGIPAKSGDVLKWIPFMIPPMLVGPTVAGLFMTAWIEGKAGLRALFARLLRRAGAPWWAAALLTAPLLMTAVPLAVSPFFPQFIPGIFVSEDKGALLRLGIAAGLGAGLFEEIGWTGFVLPQLRRDNSLLRTGLLMGFLWGAWHLPVNFWSSGGPNGELMIKPFLHSFFFSFGILPPFRLLMVWVYGRVESLLLAMAMHFSLTFGNILFVPLAAEDERLIWTLVTAAGMWLLAAVVLIKNR